MRFKPTVLLLSVLIPTGLFSAGHALAQGVQGDAPQCRVLTATAQMPVELTDAAYLGLGTESISLERASDLGLPAGTGLSVMMVAPGSPAEKAGFQKHDVLTKLDDQLLVNMAQLRVLVRMHNANDTIAVGIVRKGKAQTIKATLGSKAMLPLSPGGEEGSVFFGGPNGGPPGIMGMAPGEMISPEMLDELRAQADRMRAQPGADIRRHKHLTPPPQKDDDNETSGELSADGDGFLRFTSRTVFNDGTNTIEIEHGTKEHLRITDKAGKELYNGALPADDKAWEQVPESVRAKAKAMAKRSGIHIQKEGNGASIRVQTGVASPQKGSTVIETDETTQSF